MLGWELRIVDRWGVDCLLDNDACVVSMHSVCIIIWMYNSTV